MYVEEKSDARFCSRTLSAAAVAVGATEMYVPV